MMEHNPISEEIVDILVSKTGVKDRLFFRILIAYKFAQMATMMRAHVSFAGTVNIPTNVYALNLADSGFSKGKSVNILENEIFHKFKKNFMYKVLNDITDRNLDAMADDISIRMGIDKAKALTQVSKSYAATTKFQYAFPMSTVEGLRSLRLKLNMAGVGSTNMETDEIGSVLTNTSMLESLGLYLETYDMGNGKSKLTKTESSDEMQSAVPSNLLMFGTPSKLLDGDSTERTFIELLETGYARRMFFGYVKDFTQETGLSPEEMYDQLTDKTTVATTHAIADMFEALADLLNYNNEIVCGRDVSIELLSYQQKCNAIARDMKEHEGIKKAEMSHRYWKVLKLAACYAFVEGSTVISQANLESAMLLAEESGEAFESMMNREKPYVRLANYIGDVERRVTQVELVEDLPFYKGSESAKKELMNLAIAYGYQNGIVIKKTYGDGVEFIEGTKIEKTNLNELIVSYSSDIAKDYKGVKGKWEVIDQLVERPGLHFAAHHFEDGHRIGDKAIPGFNMIILDVDDGLNIDVARNVLAKYEYLIYTTKRHTKEKNRYRIILPMSHTLKLKPDEYKEFMKNVFEWLPFDVDEATSDIARKWLTNPGCERYRNEGTCELFPAMDFIPNTKQNNEKKDLMAQVGNLDSLQRWFCLNTGKGSRNTMMMRYAFALLDKGLSSTDILYSLEDMNGKLRDPIADGELKTTIYRSVIREEQKRSK